MYTYMKQLFNYYSNQEVKLQGNKSLNVTGKCSPNTFLQSISMGYLKLFNTVIEWPTLLTGGIQKLKNEFDLLISSMKTFSKSKSIL